MLNSLTSQIRRARYWLRDRQYQRLLVNCQHPTIDAAALRSLGYHSQYGQDWWVAETLFCGKTSGVFLDIGAHDGVTFSNTFFLERHRKWSGIAVEPSPDRFELLARNRTCTLLNVAVSRKSGRVRFRDVKGYAEQLSGIVSEYDPRHLRRMQRELTNYGGSTQDFEVTAVTLHQIVREYGLRTIDYLSIDVEGSEFAALSTIDFRHCHISVIGCENNYKDTRIPRLLARHGYRLHSRLGCDDFYTLGF